MKTLIGKISSNKMIGTVAVTVESFKMHPIYKKRLRRSRSYLANSVEKLTIGDLVVIREVRPVSKSVHFTVDQILQKAEILPGAKELKTIEEKQDPQDSVKKETKKKVSKKETKS
jgi:small subunit ribosomal protein S17